jgi:hypothetical protein
MSKQDDDFNLFLFTLEPNSLWRIAPVSDEPEVRLWDWDIKKDTTGNRYFVGTLADGLGWVSTAIVDFDPERRRGRTKSGRVYELVGSKRALEQWEIRLVLVQESQPHRGSEA